MAHLEGPQRETEPGVHAIIGVCVWRNLGFRAKARLVHSNQKEQGFAKPSEDLI